MMIGDHELLDIVEYNADQRRGGRNRNPYDRASNHDEGFTYRIVVTYFEQGIMMRENGWARIMGVISPGKYKMRVEDDILIAIDGEPVQIPRRTNFVCEGRHLGRVL